MKQLNRHKLINFLICQMEERLLHKEHTINTLRCEFDSIYRENSDRNEIEPKKHMFFDIPTFFYTSKGCDEKNIIIFLHGGGFTIGSSAGHSSFISELVRTSNIPVLSIDYKLAPEYPFPSALEDCKKIYCSLIREKYLPENVFVVGMTAGATIAFSSLLSAKKDAKQMPRAIILLSPPMNLSFDKLGAPINTVNDWVKPERLLSMRKTYLNGAAPTNPLASPYFSDFEGLPPIMVQVGLAELLYTNVMQFCEKVRVSGIEIEVSAWDDMFHAWQAFPSVLSDARDAICEISKFIMKRKLSVSCI